MLLLTKHEQNNSSKFFTGNQQYIAKYSQKSPNTNLYINRNITTSNYYNAI